MSIVEIYTDGACSPNPGIGGWGAVLSYNGHSREIYGGRAKTTNNQMEMLAAIEALKALKRPCAVTLYTDSKYLQDGITKWIRGWIKRNWKTKGKKGGDVKNKELWVELHALNQIHDVKWKWVRGHAGNPGNERADDLARIGRSTVASGG